MTNNNIPPPGIINDHILTRLPAKSLLRFRCVCKPWLSVIDSNDFVKSHLKHSVSTKSNTVIYTRDVEDSHAYTVDCVPVDKSTAVDFNNLRILTTKNYTRNDFVGSVNGILCHTWYQTVPYDDPERVCTSHYGVDVVLWNPSIRKHIMLPPFPRNEAPPFIRTMESLPTFGFGYDSANDDYKVFRIEQDWKCGGGNAAILAWDVKVFSLKSMSWTRGKGFPHHLHYYNQIRGYFASGSLHWILSTADDPYRKKLDRDDVILAFNVGSEVYRLLSLPDYPGVISDGSLVSLEGSLGLLCDYGSGHMDMWIMKDYGKKESWMRLISLDQCQCLRPLAYSKDGGQVLLEKNDERLVWYDLESKDVKKTRIRGTPKFRRDCMLYVESLVQLPGSSKLNFKDNKMMEEKTTKKRDKFLSKGFKLVL